MPRYRYGPKNNPLGNRGFELLVCWGSVFSRMGSYDVEIVYRTKPSGSKMRPQNELLKDRSDVMFLSAKELAQHITLLRATGFTFSHTLGANPSHDPDKVVHTFFIKTDDNNPFMAKLLLNALRWVSQWHKCADAFAAICADIKPKTRCEYLNALFVASYAQCPGNGHNISPYHALLLPLDETQYLRLLTLGEQDTMDHNLPSIIALEPTGTMNFKYLLKPGGYAEYVALITAEQAKVQEEANERKSEIRRALGWAV